MPVILRPLGPGDEAAATAAHAELVSDGSGFLVEEQGERSWADYLAYLVEVEAGRLPGRFGVGEVFRVAEHDGRLVGRLSLKPRLDDWLAAVGGHIGYAVRPDDRRRGHATAICRRALTMLADHGVEQALLCVDDDNVGSAAVVERCGGVLERTVWVPDEGITLRRYWAPTR